MYRFELADVLGELSHRVHAERARGLNASVVLDCPEETWSIRFADGKMSFRQGRASEPDAVVQARLQTLIDIYAGALNGVQAFLRGKVAVRGNLDLVLRLESLFSGNGGRPQGAFRNGSVPVGPWRASVMEAGTGTPVLLLHGLGATKASFLSTFDALSSTHRVIAPDLLGHGDSSKPRIRYDAPAFARYVIDLMDSLGVDRAHLVGNSLGGRISLEVALGSPDRVSSVSLLCPAVSFPWRGWVSPLLRVLRPGLPVVPRHVPHAAIVTGLRRLFADPERIPAAWYDAAADEALRIYRSRSARFALYESLRELALAPQGGENGLWARLGGLEAPAMFLWGDSDPLVPKTARRDIERYLPEARSEVLVHCGHVPQFEMPGRTNLRVRRFIDAAEGRLDTRVSSRVARAASVAVAAMG